MSNTVRLARSITLFIFMLVFTLSLVSAATQYIGTTGANQSIGNNNEIFIDNTNGRVGIGDTSPDYALDVVGDSYITGSLVVNDGSGGVTPAMTVIGGNGGNFTFGQPGSGTTEFIIDTASWSHIKRLSFGSLWDIQTQYGGDNLIFDASPQSGNSQVLVLDDDGFVGIRMDPVYNLDVNGSINTNTNLCIDGACISDWSALNTTNIAADSIGPTELADTWNLDAELDIDGNDFDVDSGTLFVDDSKNLVTFDGGSGAAYASTAGSEAISISGDVRFTGGLSQGTSSGGLLWTWGSLNLNYGAIDFFLGNNTHGARMISGMLSASAGFNNPVTYTPLSGNSAVEVTEENEVRFLYAGSVTTSPTVAAVVDTANSRLGIGTATPAANLEVSDGTDSFTFKTNDYNNSPTINTTNSKDLVLTSGSGNVVVVIG